VLNDVPRLRTDDFRKFLYIDLFIIIPIAVTSKHSSRVNLDLSELAYSSGTHFTLSSHLSKASNSQPDVKEGLGKHYWPTRNYKWYTSLGVFMGAPSGMVSKKKRLFDHPSIMLSRYTPPPPITEGHELESPTYENTVLFLISCFQYILVAGAFSIGPPYRKSMWTNGTLKVVLKIDETEGHKSIGWLMVSMGLLSLFSVVILLWPPRAITDPMILLPLPSGARIVLLMAVATNIIMSILFEEWGARKVAELIGAVLRWQRGRRTMRKAYKVVEGGMR
jgi:magnesium-transporting ATPase (P-type)